MSQAELPASTLLQYRTCRLSDTGLVMRNNEDYAGFIEPVNLAMMSQSGNLYVVADGTGATRQGERTSQYAVERLLTEYYQTPGLPTAERLVSVINLVLAEIAELAIECRNKDMHSMMSAAVIKDNLLTLASVGNCQAFLIRDGEAVQISRNQAGIEGNEPPTSSREALNQQPYEITLYQNIVLMAGDVVLLCTDGFERYASCVQVAELVHSTAPEYVCRKLVDFANAAGGSDNITVLVVMVDAPKRPAATPAPTLPLPVPLTAVKPAARRVAAPSANPALPALEVRVIQPSGRQRGRPPGREVLVLTGAVWLMTFLCMVLGSLLLMR